LFFLPSGRRSKINVLSSAGTVYCKLSFSPLSTKSKMPNIGNQTYTKQQVQQLTVARTSNISDPKSNSKKTFEKVPVVCNASDIN